MVKIRRKWRKTLNRNVNAVLQEEISKHNLHSPVLFVIQFTRKYLSSLNQLRAYTMCNLTIIGANPLSPRVRTRKLFPFLEHFNILSRIFSLPHPHSKSSVSVRCSSFFPRLNTLRVKFIYSFKSLTYRLTEMLTEMWTIIWQIKLLETPDRANAFNLDGTL